MTNALDKGYNEGRLAFRRYFAKYGPNVKQNDPRMPPNPYVGYYGFAVAQSGSSLNCGATSCLPLARANCATSSERPPLSLNRRSRPPFASRLTSFRSSEVRTKATTIRAVQAPRVGPSKGTMRAWPC